MTSDHFHPEMGQVPRATPVTSRLTECDRVESCDFQTQVRRAQAAPGASFLEDRLPLGGTDAPAERKRGGQRNTRRKAEGDRQKQRERDRHKKRDRRDRDREKGVESQLAPS